MRQVCQQPHKRHSSRGADGVTTRQSTPVPIQTLWLQGKRLSKAQPLHCERIVQFDSSEAIGIVQSGPIHRCTCSGLGRQQWGFGWIADGCAGYPHGP